MHDITPNVIPDERHVQRPISMLQAQLRHLISDPYSLDDVAVEALRLKAIYGKGALLDALRAAGTKQTGSGRRRI